MFLSVHSTPRSWLAFRWSRCRSTRLHQLLGKSWPSRENTITLIRFLLGSVVISWCAHSFASNTSRKNSSLDDNERGTFPSHDKYRRHNLCCHCILSFFASRTFQFQRHSKIIIISDNKVKNLCIYCLLQSCQVAYTVKGILAAIKLLISAKDFSINKINSENTPLQDKPYHMIHLF